MNKVFVSFLILLIAAACLFYAFPKLWGNAEDFMTMIKTGPIESIREEIEKVAPLILKNGAANAFLTVPGTLEHTNIARKENGDMPALILNTQLNTVAELRMKDMFEKQYFEHYSPQGIGAADVAKDVGYHYIAVGENIALGNFKDDPTLVKAWMDSPGHRANILNTRFTEIGIAVGKGKYEGRMTWIAVQVFGKPASLCPSLNATLKKSLEITEKAIDEMKTTIENENQAISSMQKSTPSERQIYNERAQEFNDLVKQYNVAVDKLKKDIEVFNAEIRIYNQCIKQ